MNSCTAKKKNKYCKYLQFSFIRFWLFTSVESIEQISILSAFLPLPSIAYLSLCCVCSLSRSFDFFHSLHEDVSFCMHYFVLLFHMISALQYSSIHRRTVNKPYSRYLRTVKAYQTTSTRCEIVYNTKKTTSKAFNSLY